MTINWVYSINAIWEIVLFTSDEAAIAILKGTPLQFVSMLANFLDLEKNLSGIVLDKYPVLSKTR